MIKGQMLRLMAQDKGQQEECAQQITTEMKWCVEPSFTHPHTRTVLQTGRGPSAVLTVCLYTVCLSLHISRGLWPTAPKGCSMCGGQAGEPS